MSRNISVQFEVRSMSIMKDTLKNMNINFKERGKNEISINRSYYDIIIKGNEGKISFDEMDKNRVDKICQQYMINWYKDVAIREGNEIIEEVQANGEVHIHVRH